MSSPTIGEHIQRLMHDYSIDSVLNVVALTPKDPLDTFLEMFYQIFLWALFSTMFFHLIMAGVALCRLRKHSIGRWVPLTIIVMGILGPLSGGVITSACIAWAFSTSSKIMSPFIALVFGLLQSVVCVVVSFTKILATL